MLTRETLLAACWHRRGDHRGCYRRQCAACGAWFYAGRPEARYCRGACRQRAYRARLKKDRQPGDVPLELSGGLSEGCREPRDG